DEGSPAKPTTPPRQASLRRHPSAEGNFCKISRRQELSRRYYFMRGTYLHRSNFENRLMKKKTGDLFSPPASLDIK
ncbi:MAG: hypothetical protein FWE84_06500, partial [Firmicutes bacterium]|nr:hypothetical protein [Bacillota bacterium]